MGLALAGCLASARARTLDDPQTTAKPSQTKTIVQWPTADLAPLAQLHANTPDRVPMFSLDSEAIPPETPFTDITEHLVTTHEIIANELTDTGLLRVYHDLIAGDELPPDSKLMGFGLGFKPNASFIPALWWQLQGEAAQARAQRLSAQSASSSGRPPGIETRSDEHDLLLDQGVLMHIPTTITGNERGIVVHLWSLGPNDYEQGVLDRFARHGWLVVDVDADVRNRPPNWPAIARAREAQLARASQLYDQARQASTDDTREHQRALRNAAYARAAGEIPLPESAFAVHRGDDLVAKGALIARAIDTTLAQHAYAVEAIVAYLDRTHPALQSKPIIIAGFSAGAIVTPTVTARLRRRFADRPLAMLLVGGAGDLFSTAIGSSLTHAGLDLTPPGSEPPDAQTIGHIAQAYRAHAQLDPLTLAPSLRDTPAYFLLGSHDTMVPYAQGKLLAAQFPNARVDTMPLGHEALFLTLPFKQGSIVRFIEHALDPD